MTASTPPEVKRAADLIERYLASHPQAADSLDGIVRWWLARQCYEEARAVAGEAVARLVDRGVMRVRRGPGRRAIYERADRADRS